MVGLDGVGDIRLGIPSGLMKESLWNVLPSKKQQGVILTFSYVPFMGKVRKGWLDVEPCTRRRGARSIEADTTLDSV